MSALIVVEDERMNLVMHSQTQLQQLATGATWGEGPVYCPKDESIIWSDAHGDRLLRWSEDAGVTVVRQPSHYQNGNDRDLEGRLVACSGGDRAVIRQELNGEWHILVDRYQGKRFNSPNDLTVKSDGTIWFTDPSYGLTQTNQGYGGEQEQSGCFVYRFDSKTSEIDAVIQDMVRPNGLSFSPDERLLYVSDSAAFDIPGGPHHIRVYNVVGDRHIANGRVFAEIDPGQPDGLGVDAQGNVFVCAEDGVHIYAPEGQRLGKILVPEICSNLCFGGTRRDQLFITAGHSLYRISLNTCGVKLPRNHPLE
jgi:gluconolactonase